jgi:hypothetical protein
MKAGEMSPDKDECVGIPGNHLDTYVTCMLL